MSKKMEVLKTISENLPIDTNTQVSFSQMLNFHSLKAEELDDILNELEAERYIDQLVVKGHDLFTLRITSKGANAACGNLDSEI